MTRRTFVSSLVPRPAEISREVFIRSPRKGIAVMAMAYYRRRTGGEMVSIEERWSRSDTIDVAYYRTSNNSGKSWSAPRERKTGEQVPSGMLRRHLRGGWVDPATGRFIEFWLEGVLPTDDPLEGMRQWQIYYAVDGRTRPQQIIHGGDYTPAHPLPGVWRGKNSVMLGDHTCQPLALRGGTILVPVSIAPLNPDGTLFNPHKALTFQDAAVLIGTWKGRRIDWEMSELLKIDPDRSTRGLPEPTLGQLTRNRILMVMRGSNDRKPELPSYKWYSISHDAGRSWQAAAPWTYTNGQTFFSPSACSQLLAHPNGKLYWLGNITPANPRGNRPRYPFVIGEVDQDSGLLIRDSVRMIDDKGINEDPLLTLSNFYARVDRTSGGIALHMTRLFAFSDGWEGDAMLYTIRV